MGSTSKQASTSTQSAPGYEGHFTEIGDMTVAFEAYTEDADLAGFFTGLPDDQCQATHLGFVLSGRVGFRHHDGSVEEITAGQAYVVGPGHTPILYAGSEVVEFTRTSELAATMAVVEANLAAMAQ